MPYRSVVKGIIKVHVFSFPKDKELSDVWIRTIKRDNFSPSKFSRVSIFFVLKNK